MSEKDQPIECELVKIVIREDSDQQYIFLKEKVGERAFPIIIGVFEASAIDRHVRGVETPRPLTHDLLESVIEALGARVLKVVVNELKDNTFYARLHLLREGGVLELDCRPSDAIALAVQSEAPIFVAEEVLEAVTGL